MGQAASIGGQRGAGKGGGRRALVEICIAYGLILLVIWTPRPWQKVLWWIAAGAVVALTCRSFDGLKAMGLRRENLLRSLWIVGAALLLAAVAVLLAAQMHTLRLPDSPLLLLKGYWAYAVWAGAQQFLLQCFFLLRLLRVLPSRRGAVCAAAALFALAHLPNPLLVCVTAGWGTAACLLFLRYRNLYTLAMAHAILGIGLAVTIPGGADHNMRVGLGYLRYHHRHSGQTQRSQRDQSASTVAWVTAEAPTRRC